jgi:hypothetical protein
MTQSECPSKVRTHSPVARSQSRRVLSLDAESARPWGSATTQETAEMCELLPA